MQDTHADPIVIIDAIRTPMGALNGAYHTLSAAELGAACIRSLIERTELDPNLIDSTIMGCVLPAGVGQAPARQAALNAGLSQQVHAATVNKVCGSGIQSMHYAAMSLLTGASNIAIAGGMENMSRAPYMLDKARSGYRLGHGKLMDHMFTDGLEDAYGGTIMGQFAEATAKKYGFTREQQDAFALESLSRAHTAIANNWFDTEITPVTITGRKGETTVTTDEPPQQAKPEKIPQLKPAFAQNGTVTAANSSSIADGAAAAMMMRASQAKLLGLEPIGKIHGFSTHSHTPEWFTTAPVSALEKLLKQVNWQASDIDLWEINEAFAVVTMAAMHDLNLEHSKVNVFGGGCALGHPLGATGTRIVVTLLNALKHQKKTRGIAGLCIGGGEAIAVALERL